MRQLPWENKDDPRSMTELDSRAFIEAAKVWGKLAPELRSSDPTTVQTWYWECFIAALRIYEFERYKTQIEEARANALDAKANADRWS